jgi:hypothetical protein
MTHNNFINLNYFIYYVIYYYMDCITLWTTWWTATDYILRNTDIA